ncbi:DUF2189 domain-containing protein [Rhizobium sp. LjRoot254]|uniref:DUF2189 domain-containing protein n=1 Tax=Rhizobium sp. LjRoot254 TaxID=3342297 RepID=UPI003ED11182
MATSHVMVNARGEYARPVVRKVGTADIMDALKLGLEDFNAKPSHYVFLCLMYPIAGIVLAYWSVGENLVPLLYPLMSGFALLGPIAALGLYEISRRREQGLDSSWFHALEVRHSPAMPSIIAVSVLLLVLFIVWLMVAQRIYVASFGESAPASISSFVSDVLTTPAGWSMILWGNIIGFFFAAVVLATTVVTFPLLLDRHVRTGVAINASIRATFANPGPVALWGLIVAGLLVAGMIPFFIGLAIVLPVLGHATWHFYRKLIVPMEEDGAL